MKIQYPGILLLVFATASVIWAQQQETGAPQVTEPEPERPDISKIATEEVLEKLIEDGSHVRNQLNEGNGTETPSSESIERLLLSQPRFLSKGLIEGQLEDLVADARPPVSLPATDQNQPDAQPENPACQPGLVNWHASPESAQASSRQSGKPVMLFQLLGQLDQRFT